MLFLKSSFLTRRNIIAFYPQMYEDLCLKFFIFLHLCLESTWPARKLGFIASDEVVMRLKTKVAFAFRKLK
jgi:hypothetical protein